MLINITVLDDAFSPVFKYQTEINQLNLMIIAESREKMVKEKGAEWTAGGVTFCGKQLVEKFNASNKKNPDLQKEATETAMALWLFQSIYCGVTAESFMKTNLDLRISPDGTVQSTSHPIKT